MAMNYSDKVMEHFTNPQNVGEIENASGCGTVGNAVCGDIMRVYLDIDDNGVIQDAKFKTFGCGAAIATSSMATVLVKGKTVQEALEVTNKAVMDALDGLPPVKVHCSLLAEEAIHAALWDYAEKHGIVIEGLEKPVTEPFEFLPDVRSVLDSMIPSYVSGFIYSALIDSFCCEQDARMTAMDSANRNAESLLGDLSLEYNRVRQAAITQEITEVSAGAKAQRQKHEKKE